MRYLVGANIKMYRTWQEANQWLADIDRQLPQSDLVDVALFPPFFSLVNAHGFITRPNIGWGAQNMAWEARGPFTGEASPLMLKELGCRYVVLGHHERRLYFNENDRLVNLKIKLALAHGLRALVCVGEDAEYCLSGSESFLLGQMNEILEGVEPADPADLVIAYEPRWAIGQDESAGAMHARLNCEVIRECLVDSFGAAGREMRLIYGGSVTLKDLEDMLLEKNINGLFIGRTALNPANFVRAVRAAQHQAELDQAATAA